MGFVLVGEMIKTVSRGLKKSIEAAAGSVLFNGGQFRTDKLMGFVLSVGSKRKLHIYRRLYC